MTSFIFGCFTPFNSFNEFWVACILSFNVSCNTAAIVPDVHSAQGVLCGPTVSYPAPVWHQRCHRNLWIRLVFYLRIAPQFPGKNGKNVNSSDVLLCWDLLSPQLLSVCFVSRPAHPYFAYLWALKLCVWLDKTVADNCGNCREETVTLETRGSESLQQKVSKNSSFHWIDRNQSWMWWTDSVWWVGSQWKYFSQHKLSVNTKNPL